MSFQAVQYSPAPGLVSIHNTARLFGVNQLTTEGFDTITSQTGPLYQYAVGVIVPAVLMILIFIIWGFSLIFAKCCCKGCCSKNIALFLFVGSCSLSLIGWAIGLAGNVNTTKGVNAMLDGVGAVQGLSKKVVGLTYDVANFSDSMFALAVNMEQQCQNPNVSFPFTGISEGLNGTISSAIGPDGLGGTLNKFNDEIDRYRGVIEQYVNWREVGTMIVIIVTMVILFIFMLTTALRVMESTPESCRPCMKFSSRSTSCLVFLFGILLLLIIWIFVALIHLIVTVGADLCVPSINSNINRLANEVSNKTYSGVDPCEAQSFRDSTPGIICYYQTCQGTNKLADLADPISTNNDFSKTLLDTFRQALNDSNVTDIASPECFPSMDKFVDKAGGVFTFVDRALNLTTCAEINPVYAAFLYSGLCNGLFNGLVFTYVSCIIAATFMMLAMSIFRIFDFNMYEYGRLPEGYYVDQKAGGQVVSTGGPVTQAV